MSKTKVTVITPDNYLSLPDFKEFWEKRELLYVLISMSIRSKYRQRALGFLWAIIHPLIYLVLFTVIFGGMANIKTGEQPYPLFALAALLPWQYFTRLVTEITSSLVSGIGVISKIYVPRLTMLLVPCGGAFLDFIIGMILLAALLVFYGTVPSLATLATFPIFFFLSTLLAISIGLWVSVINVTFRDVGTVMPVLMQVLFYATPIVYPIEMVPDRFKDFYEMSPLTVIIQGFRYSFLGGDMPDILDIIMCAVLILLIMVPGLFFFNKLSQTMVDRL